jgi:hypothetical protein
MSMGDTTIARLGCVGPAWTVVDEYHFVLVNARCQPYEFAG